MLPTEVGGILVSIRYEKGGTKMLLIKLIEGITYLVQELLCLIAILVLKVIEYRWLAITLAFLALLVLGGLYVYGIKTN